MAAPFLPLYDLVCVEPEPSRALPRAALDSGVDANGVRQSVTTGASLLLARAEAAAAAAGRVVTGEEKATAALLMALKEKARLAEEMRGELAAARAAANASVTEAAQKAAAAAADAAAAAQRAAAAEAELAQARSQIARATQEAKVRTRPYHVQCTTYCTWQTPQPRRFAHARPCNTFCVRVCVCVCLSV